MRAIVRLMTVPVERRDEGWLRDALQAAIQLELGTIPPYLFAFWSIDTSADPDHVGGNETLSKAGQTLFTAPGSIGVTGDFLGGVASILSAQQVLERMSAPAGRTFPRICFSRPSWPSRSREHWWRRIRISSPADLC